jgi:hypothetical protein
MSKSKYYPMTMCGAFFTEEYLDLVKEVVMDEDTDITDYIKEYLQTGTDLTQYPSYMKEVVMVHNTDVLYEEEDSEPGFYVGVPFFEVPEHFSIKRVCIDIRKLFVSSGLVTDDIHPDTIKVFSKIIKVEEDD